MKGNDIKILGVHVDNGAFTTGKNDVVEIDGLRIEGLQSLKVETAHNDFRLVTMSFLVRNIEWTAEKDEE